LERLAVALEVLPGSDLVSMARFVSETNGCGLDTSSSAFDEIELKCANPERVSARDFALAYMD
jgi:hypothetical protein